MTSIYKNFILDEKRGFIFAYVPKVACTNWKSLLRYLAGHDDWLDNKLAHDKQKSGLRFLDLRGGDADWLKKPEVKKFAMVRNPYSRTLSAYLNKIEKRLPVNAQPSHDHFDKVLSDIDSFRAEKLDQRRFPEITFEVFLLWLKYSESWFVRDEHWAPQSSLLLQPGLVFDHLGRFENLAEDAARILESMECDQPFPTQKDVKFAPTDAQSKIDKYYTPESYALVDDIFAEDFKHFGYERSKHSASVPTLAQLGDSQQGDPLSTAIDQALQKKWYYVAELRKNQFTKGTPFKNIAVTRKVLEAVDVKNAKALDMSTMEGMFSVLLSLRGAQVLATDSIDNRERLDVLKSVYGAKFEYYPHAPVENYVEFAINQQASHSYKPKSKISHDIHSPYGFDLVLSSGVIYHVHNPVQHIVNFRRLCKTGGLVVLESAALLSDEIEMVHDWWGGEQTWNGNATWYPSTRALEVFMRAAFLEPLGYTYIHVSGKTDHKLCRIAIVARAVTDRQFTAEQEGVIGKSELYKNYDFKPILPSARLTGVSRLPMEVDSSKIIADGDLRASKILKHAPLDFDDSYLTLRLGDR